MKHFISMIDYSHDKLTAILDRADELAIAWNNAEKFKK